MTTKHAPRKRARPTGDYSQPRRLVHLFELLHRGDVITPERTARKLGVTVRTLQRDLVVLDEVLRPALVCDRSGDLGGPRYHLRSSSRGWKVTPAQVLAVLLGAELASFLSGPTSAADVDPILRQLESSLNPGEQRRLRRWTRRVAVIAPGQTDYRRSPEIREHLARILSAMQEERAVRLAYLSPGRARAGLEARRLCVRPLGIVHYRNGLYFIVDVEDGDFEDGRDRRVLLALERMSEVSVDLSLPSRVVPDDFDARAFFGAAFGIWKEGEVHDVLVHVDADWAAYVEKRALHPRQRIEQQTDGLLVYLDGVDGLGEVADWVISLGEHAEVLAPPALRRLVGERLERAARRYRE
jgi:proteasome accessory factor B